MDFASSELSTRNELVADLELKLKAAQDSLQEAHNGAGSNQDSLEQLQRERDVAAKELADHQAIVESLRSEHEVVASQLVDVQEKVRVLLYQNALS